ncbi:MAG TPA: efflux RND transporter periplasmic adaptor subunit [Tepidisphaeraceae bacterium]|nr:efflux RND transporter periplasmic adaptor subunit [Tepidisphaeraceae bacterium]
MRRDADVRVVNSINVWWRPALWRRGGAVLLVLAGLVVLLQGCERNTASAPSGPPVVSVSRPLQETVTSWDEYPGRLSATDTVDVRARVGGFIEQAPFKEGATVNQGDVLFIIDVRPYQADLDRAQASLAQAEAQQRYASSEYTRLEPLQKSGAVGELQFLNARQALETANAAVASARAAVETARLNVEWCRVTAPIIGRVGRKLVTPGNLITGGTAQATLLTTLTTLNPIYCYAEVDERSVLRYQRLNRQQARPSARSNRLPAQLAVGDTPEFAYQGLIDFVNNQIDPNTGTITIRATFDNPDGRLIPGFYARLRILGRGPHLALLVPEEAIGSTLAQRYVLVVGPDNVVQYRPITPGNSYGNLREVEGIGPNEWVVVNGLVTARPGAKVQPQEVAIQAPQTQPAQTQSVQTQPTQTESIQIQPAQTQPVREQGLGQGPSRSSGGPAEQGAGTTGMDGGGGGQP